MYTVLRSTAFKRAFKRCVKRGLDVSEFENVVNLLRETGSLPKKIQTAQIKLQIQLCMGMSY